MNKIKILGLAALMTVSFYGGKMFVSYAGAGDPGTNEDPIVSESYMKQELGKIQSEVNKLKNEIADLKKDINNGSSSGGGSSSSGGSNTSKPESSLGTATVTTEVLNVRSGAGTSYSKVGELRRGTKVTLLEKKGSWYKVKTSSITGWVSGDYLSINGSSSSSSLGTATVTASVLNIRDGASTSAKKIGEVAKGAKVTVLEKKTGWWKIKIGSITGWASSDYLKMN